MIEIIGLPDAVSVLGVEYVIKMADDLESKEGTELAGLAKLYSKEILLSNSIAENYDGVELENYTKNTLRHELIHAFLHESGRADWCFDEDMVEYLAMMIPKMAKAMMDTKCLMED